MQKYALRLGRHERPAPLDSLGYKREGTRNPGRLASFCYYCYVSVKYNSSLPMESVSRSNLSSRAENQDVLLDQALFAIVVK